MRLDALVAWYQKKIGTYDKQQWEKTIEQKILAGISHLPLKNTKLKTELIDVDLVRGSTFPKAKSKLSILTVLYLAALRFLLLPVYARWWVQQTSPGVFLLLLTLYLLQMLNLGIYSYCARSPSPVPPSSTDTATGSDGAEPNAKLPPTDTVDHIVTISDFLIPLALSLLLSVIHSQIVATASNSNGSSLFSCGKLSQKCFSHGSATPATPGAASTGTGTSLSTPAGGVPAGLSKKQREQRIRRKRRVRAHSETQAQSSSPGRAVTAEERDRKKAFASVGGSKSATSSPARTAPKKGACSTSSSTSSDAVERAQLAEGNSNEQQRQPEVLVGRREENGSLRMEDRAPNIHRTANETEKHTSIGVTIIPSTNSSSDHSPPNGRRSGDHTQEANPMLLLPSGLRRRNVNWDPTVPERSRPGPSSLLEPVVDDDGFESLNGKSSGGEDSAGNVFLKDHHRYRKVAPFGGNDWNAAGETEAKDHQSDSDTDTLKNSITTTTSNYNTPTIAELDGVLDPQRKQFTEGGYTAGSQLELAQHDTPQHGGRGESKELVRQRRNKDSSKQPLQRRAPTALYDVGPDEKKGLGTSCSDETDEENNEYDLHSPSPPHLHLLHSSPPLRAHHPHQPMVGPVVRPSPAGSSPSPHHHHHHLLYLHHRHHQAAAVVQPAAVATAAAHSHHTLHPHHFHHSPSVLTEGEECSYSSELDHSDTQNEHSDDDYELEDVPTLILNPACGANDRVSCTIWEAREAKKAEMSVLDISSAIIERVEAMPESCDYVYIGVVLSVFLSLVPAFCRLCEATVDSTNSTEVNFLDMPVILFEKASFSLLAILRFAFGETTWERFVLVLGFLLRLVLTFLVFFLLAVAERTFKQRFLYAKLFSHLTSSRRAQKSGIPHFRLNKVRNIKTWLCVRSYLKRRGPQNSVDVIVSAAFIITLLLLAFLSVEWLKDSVHLHSQFNLEALTWSCAFGTFLLRFMTLGTKINKKYKSVSVLITEQINLYVQIEQKPNKKEELMISNNVLKLAADLLKELESPFKISGLSANPYLYTTVKVVILSALSGVLSEMLGFKLKLHKIKIK
ncbi:protein phtf isoform X1 [Anopheles gambiae]|uniref:Phtf-FEM1B_bdg domain-containing protein n=1 Tax=Anopheles coluzzii TaxID=1518534 RepID=A0A6E8VQ69_ANOCL|nr:protein phtf isoform X1 [Anopheles coluzzii]XP_049463001.1 protein phtf isoform X1 [Anopheles coluzzii]XP_061500770.1 protein phtf isoform X1 [Anopheles gambiae]XP_316489.5 protein phtf isoform X1 [Anopheles gambiae]